MYGTCLRRITQFYLPPTRLSTNGMNHTYLYSVTALWLVLISLPAQGKRLSWLSGLVKY